MAKKRSFVHGLIHKSRCAGMKTARADVQPAGADEGRGEGAPRRRMLAGTQVGLGGRRPCFGPAAKGQVWALRSRESVWRWAGPYLRVKVGRSTNGLLVSAAE